MTNWKHTVLLGDLLTKGDDIPFTERRDAIVQRIRETSLPDPDDELEWILDDMAQAPDPNAFDNDGWYRFYNWADDHDVWVDGWTAP